MVHPRPEKARVFVVLGRPKGRPFAFGGSMQPEPEAGAATVASVDTASSDDAALSEPTASSATVESPDATADAEAAPTPDDESEEAGADEGTDEQKAAAKTRSERQRDAWLESLKKDPAKLREALGDETLSPLVAEEVAKIEATRKAEQAEADRQAKTSEAVKARQDKLAAWQGTPESNQALQAEIEQIATDLAAVTTNPSIDTDFDLNERSKALAKQLQEKRAEMARRYENSQMGGVLWDAAWDTIEGGFASAAQFPELAKDEKLKNRYLKADGGIEGALVVLREILRADVIAEKDAEIAAVRKDLGDKLKAAELDARTWRQRAGGEELAGVGAGAPSSDQVWTRERLRTLSQDEFRKHRDSIERAAAAGRIQ